MTVLSRSPATRPRRPLLRGAPSLASTAGPADDRGSGHVHGRVAGALRRRRRPGAAVVLRRGGRPRRGFVGVGRRRASLPRPGVRDRRHQHRSRPPARGGRDPPTGRAPPAHVGGAQAPALHRGRGGDRRAWPRSSTTRRCSCATAVPRPSTVPSSWLAARPVAPASSPSVVGSMAARWAPPPSPRPRPPTRRATDRCCRTCTSRPTASPVEADDRMVVDAALAELDEILAAHATTLAAMVVEPVLGEGGYIVPPRRVADRAATALRRPRHPPRVRRGAVRLRAHGPPVRGRDLRHRARRPALRQGGRLRAPAGGDHGRRGAHGPVAQRSPRLHLRRQPGVVRRGRGHHRGARARRPLRPGRRPGRSSPCPPRVAAGRCRRRRAWHRRHDRGGAHRQGHGRGRAAAVPRGAVCSS